MKWRYYSNKPYKLLETSDFNVLYDNECHCVKYDDDGDVLYDENQEPLKADTCDGMCGSFQMEHFEDYAKQWFEPTNHRYFIDGYPRWNGSFDGAIIAKDPKDFIQKFNADFSIKWLFHREPKKPESKKYNPTVLRLIVSSHDVPMGKWVTVEKDTKPWVSYY